MLRIPGFGNCHILVVGDLMLDRYLWGEVNRISPEAPVPVFRIKKRSEICGGAGNVVSNLAGLGCNVTLLGVCGEDGPGKRLTALLSKNGIQTHILQDPSRPTITKTRIVSLGQQLLRLDDEETFPLDSDLKRKMLDFVKQVSTNCNGIILSDYGKGVFQTKDLAQSIIRIAKKKGIPVMVDPKGKKWKRYKGATCITPNTKELEHLVGETVPDEKKLVEVMREVLTKYNLSCLLVTRGPLGMCLMGNDGESTFIPALAKEVYDVSGAGDTVIATLAACVGAGLDFQEAARLANMAAGVVVGKIGTQPITLLELKASMALNDGTGLGTHATKITSLSSARVQVEAWRANGEKIVFTNGCFDLLHPGHIHLLSQAKALGDRLIVGLNSDKSVRRLKGPTRPILRERDRAAVLGSLDYVDLVIIFEEDTPVQLIEALKPDILVKGSDYALEQVVGRKIVESYGGKVRLVNLLKGHSTTEIANKVLKNHRSVSE